MEAGKIKKILIILLFVGLVPFTASVSDVDVLVVNDGHTLSGSIEYTEGMFENRYRNALNSTEGVNVDFYRTESGQDVSGPSYGNISQYDILVWYTLADYEQSEEGFITFTQRDRNNIRKFVNEGGSVYVTGHRLDDETAGDFKGQGGFFRDVFSVRHRNDGTSPSYWRLTDNGYPNEPEQWEYKEVYDELKQGAEGTYRLYFEEEQNIVLKGENFDEITESQSSKLNTSIEPANALGVISDNCIHTQDNSELDTCSHSKDTFDIANNVLVGDGNFWELGRYSENSNSDTNTKTLSVDYAGTSNGKVILGAVTKNSGSPASLNKVSSDSGSIRKIESINNSKFALSAYVLNPYYDYDDGTIDIRANKETDLSAITLSYDDVAEGLPVSSVSLNKKESGDISTSVQSESNDFVIDFITSSSEIDELDSQVTSTDIGDDDSQILAHQKDGSERIDMAHSGGSDYTHVAMNINWDETFSEYYIETDGYDDNQGEPVRERGNSGNVEGDYPDEFASTLVRSYNQSSRTVYNSIGFEAIQGQNRRKSLMNQIITYLSGPLANNTEVYSGQDIGVSEVDESKYTNNTLNIVSSGKNLQDYPGRISEARYFHSNSSKGLNPPFETGFENKSVFESRWNIETESEGYYEITGSCGVKKGQKALRLDGNNNEDDLLNDDVVNATTNSIDLSAENNVTLRFYVLHNDNLGDGRPCDGPEAAQGEDLSVYYYDGGQWAELDRIENDGYKYWEEKEYNIPESDLTENFKIRFRKHGNDYEDAWIIDEVELDSKFNNLDYNRDSSEVDVETRDIDATKVDADLDSYDRGINITYGVQYKDSSDQGFWGPAEEKWVVVDTQEPSSPTALEFSQKYTNKQIVNATLSTDVADKFKPDLVRFTCQDPSSNPEWGEWKTRSSQFDQKFEINITNQSLGCSQSNGNRTIHVQTRDYAGNLAPETRKDWIIYDDEDPSFTGAIPEGESTINSDEDLNISATDNFLFPTSLESDEVSIYNLAQSTNQSFLVNQFFSLQFEEGETSLDAWINDKASNTDKVELNYDIDDTKPVINVTPENSVEPVNDTVVSPDDSMFVEAFDRNFDRFVINGGQNTTFEDNATYNPTWNEGFNRDLEVWANDTAGNLRFKNYKYTVDGSEPVLDSVKPRNLSYIRSEEVLEFNYSDVYSDVETYSHSDSEKVPGTSSDLGLDPNWGSQGKNSIEVNATDSASNTLSQLFTFKVDDTAPDVFVSNYSRDQTSEGWVNSNIAVAVNATDNMNMSIISYGVEPADNPSKPSLYSNPGENISASVTCSDGQTCEKVIVFNGNDSAGNKFVGDYAESDVIAIDKKAPNVNIESPSRESTVSGEVNLEAAISDQGIGVRDANYTVYNASDKSQEFDSGDLNESNNWSYTWNSENDIADTEEVTLGVEVEDKFGQRTQREINFSVENQRTTVTIQDPTESIVSEEFALNIDARRPGSLENLSWHNFTIKENSQEIYAESTALNDKDEHKYERTFDTSNLEGDANYTLNTTARSDGGEYATSQTWFYLDTVPPNTSIDSQNLNDSWVTGEINVDYKAADNVENNSIKLEYSNSSSDWVQLRSLEFGDKAFNFDTENYCKDNNQTECKVRIVADDSVDNTNQSMIQFKVDNTPPQVQIKSPPSGAWQNSDFEVSREISDNVIENDDLECSVRINSSSWENQGSKGVCNNNFTVQIPEECDEQGGSTCKVEVRAQNPYLDLETNKDRFYSVDTERPEIYQSPSPNPGSIINGTQEISLGFRDTVSEITYSIWDDGLQENLLETETLFEPGWTQSGEKTLTIEINDSANNLRTENYQYVFDNRAPELESANLSIKQDENFNEVRVYRGEQIKFNANVSENIETEYVKATINKENKRNISLNLESGNLEDGVWSKTLVNGSTGLYNITEVYIRDKAGNETIISSDLPSFRVVNYSQNIEFEGKKWLNAGINRSFTYDIDFNRSQGYREVKVYVPPSKPGTLADTYFDLQNINCEASACNVTDEGTYLNLTYNGSNSEVSVKGDVLASTPEEDISGKFRTVLLENQRTTQTEIRAPKLVINNTGCSPSCTVDQFSRFNLSIETLNNDTVYNSGKARQVRLQVASEEINNRITELGNVSSGDKNTTNLTSLSIDSAGNFTLEESLADVTGEYGDASSVEIEVLDAENPEIIDVSPESQRINVNDTINLVGDLQDNVEVAKANLTLSYPNGTKTNLSLKEPFSGTEWFNEFNSTQNKGVYELTDIYVADQRGNRNSTNLSSSFTVTELKINTSVNKKNITARDSVNLTANISGNSSDITEVKLNISTPKGENKQISYSEVGLNNTLPYEGFVNSGNYSFNLTAQAGLSATNNTSDVFVRYGNSSLTALEGDSNTVEIPNGGSVNFSWAVNPINGSLQNVNLTLASSDTNIAEFVDNEKDVGNITNQKGISVETSFIDPENTGNTTISAEIIPEKGGESFTDVDLEVVDSETEKPEINNLTLGQQIVNLNEGLMVEAEITDNSVLDNSTLIIERPENGSNVTEKFLMNRKGLKEFKYQFLNTSEVGEYNYTLKTWDISGNMAAESGSFNVTDEYDIGVTADQDIYVKEESANLDFDVRDASGEPVEGYDIEVTLDRDGSNTTLVRGEDIKEASYFVDQSNPPDITRDPDDLPLDYQVIAEVNNSGNTAKTVKNISVTRVLEVDIEFEDDEYVAPGEEFGIITSWKEPINDPLSGDLNGFVLCDDCPSNYKSLIENLDTGNYVQTLKAPNATGSYSFIVKGTFRGNSESQNPTTGSDAPPVKTFQVVTGGEAPNGSEQQSSPAGGFGGGGGPTMEITRISPGVSIPPSQDEVELAVNTNIAGECVYSRNAIPESVSFEEANSFDQTGGVNHSSTLEIDESITYSYSVMCASENVNQTTDIIFSKGEEELTAFQPTFPETLTPGNSSIIQNTNGSGFFSVYNNQSRPIDLEFQVESDCCEGSVRFNNQDISSATIEPGEERGLSLNMYAPLHVREGVYSASLRVTGENASRERSIDFTVRRNDAVQNYTELVQKAAILNSSIRRYSQAGVDTSNMREALRELENDLEQANNSIQNDDEEGLQSRVQIGYRNANRVDKMLEDASIERYIRLNWWKWGLGFMVSYVILFLIVMVGIPYYRIQTELTRINSQLQTAIDARKKGEKQYFQRKIDKDTFNKMMTERQNEVLQLRGQKEDLKEEVDGFLRGQLTVENYLKAPWKGMDELEKWWAANRRARENLNNGSDENKE